jgi:hypothetical protein
MDTTSLNVTTEYDECAHQRVSKRSKGKVIVVLASLVLGGSWLLHTIVYTEDLTTLSHILSIHTVLP